jgi:hypothetical protein
MSDPSKRVVVDRIEFLEVVQWWRILRAIPMAMQPPKLIIGLLVVVALLTAGRIWDASTESRISPAGLDGRLASDSDRAVYREAWRAAMREFAPGAGGDDAEPSELAPAAMNRAFIDGYVRVRADRLAEIDTLASDAKAAAHDLLRSRDEAVRGVAAELERLRPKGAFEASLAFASDRFHTLMRSILTVQPQAALVAAKELLWTMPKALWLHERTFAVVMGLIAAVVVAFGGGALSRMAACEFAGQERLRVREAIDFALGTWFQLALALILPLAIVAVLVLLLAAAGAVLMWGWLDVVGGPLYGLALIVGLFIAFLVLGYYLASGLLLPAIACENCDAGEALQRGYSYAVHRTLHLAWYGVVALVTVALGYLVVSALAVVAIKVTAAAVGAFIDDPSLSAAGDVALLRSGWEARLPAALGGHEAWAAWFIVFWEHLARSLVASFVLACGFSAATIVYLLMRHVSDGQDPGEIWRPGAAVFPVPVAAASDNQAEDRDQDG